MLLTLAIAVAVLVGFVCEGGLARRLLKTQKHPKVTFALHK